MLEIKNIYKTFNAGTVNEKCALKGVNLTLEDGDFVTVIGGNGAGKSTLLNAPFGFFPHLLQQYGYRFTIHRDDIVFFIHITSV